MYFKDFVAVLLRRWRVVLVGAIVTLSAGAAAIFLVPTNHQSTGQMLLLLPPQAAGATPINPYLNLDPGLTIAASLIAATVSSDATQEEMEAAGYLSKYSIALNPGTGPLLEISTEDTNPAMAVATRDEIMRRLDTQLDRIQIEEDVPKRQFIHSRRNNVTDTAEAVPGSKIRALAAIGALGVVTTFIIAFLIDRRPARPRSDATESAEANTDDDPDQPGGSFAWGVSPDPDGTEDLDEVQVQENAVGADPAGDEHPDSIESAPDRPFRSGRLAD